MLFLGMDMILEGEDERVGGVAGYQDGGVVEYVVGGLAGGVCGTGEEWQAGGRRGVGVYKVVYAVGGRGGTGEVSVICLMAVSVFGGRGMGRGTGLRGRSMVKCGERGFCGVDVGGNGTYIIVFERFDRSAEGVCHLLVGIRVDYED